MKNRLLKELALYYDYLEQKISNSLDVARNNDKKLIIIITENHVLKSHNFLDFLVFAIAKKLGIKNFYHEHSCDLETFDKARSVPLYKEVVEEINVAEQYGMRYVPIDMIEDAAIDPISDEGIKTRNKFMVQQLNKHAKDGVAIVGGRHMIGICTTLEGNTINRDIYEIVHLPFSDSISFKSLPLANLGLALDYYLNQDMLMLEIAEKLKYLMENRIFAANRFFYKFLEEHKSNSNPKYNSDVLKQRKSDFFEIYSADVHQYFLREALYRYVRGDKNEKTIILTYITDAIKKGLNPDGLFSDGMPYLFGMYDSELLLIFLNAGANPNLRWKGYTLLEWAALRWRNQGLVKVLLKYGADPYSGARTRLNMIDRLRYSGEKEAMNMILHYRDHHDNRLLKGEFSREPVCTEETVKDASENLVNSFIRCCDHWSECFARKILDFSKELTKDCPSYFPPGRFNYWNDTKPGNSHAFNLTCINPEPYTGCISQPPQYPCAAPYCSLGY